MDPAMARRPRRLGLSGTALTAVLDNMRDCRKSMIELHGAHPPRAPIYREAGHLLKNIDALALLLTGKEGYFLPDAHSGPPPPPKRGEEAGDNN